MRKCGTRYSSRSLGYDKSPREQDRIAFLWEVFETNYIHGKYPFVFLAYHMLTMRFAYTKHSRGRTDQKMSAAFHGN